MKAKKIFQLMIFLLFFWGCDGPETVVTNFVHADGSVTRRVEMRSSDEVVEPENCKVPVDSTWHTVTSLEVSESGDTTWIIVAEKTFPSVDSINSDYSSGKDINFMSKRSAVFSKRFRWFSTLYTFSEKIDRLIPYGYPIDDYLKGEERDYFSLPESVAGELIKGSDSLKYQIVADSVDKQVNRWFNASIISGWLSEISRLLEEAGVDSLVIVDFSAAGKLIQGSEYDNFDSDSVLAVFMGDEFLIKYQDILESAEDKIDKDLEVFFSIEGYTMQTVMPGKLIDGNGYFSASGEISWPVKPEIFIFDDYEMWAESRVPNKWAWIVSFVFVVIVLTGLIIRRRTKK